MSTLKERYAETLKKYPQEDIDPKRLAFKCKRLGIELEEARQSMAINVAIEDESRFIEAQFQYEKAYDAIEQNGCRLSVEKKKEQVSKLSTMRSILASTKGDKRIAEANLQSYVKQATERIESLGKQIKDQENRITEFIQTAGMEDTNNVG